MINNRPSVLKDARAGFNTHSAPGLLIRTLGPQKVKKNNEHNWRVKRPFVYLSKLVFVSQKMKRRFISGAEKGKKQKLLKIHEANSPKVDAFIDLPQNQKNHDLTQERSGTRGL